MAAQGLRAAQRLSFENGRGGLPVMFEVLILVCSIGLTPTECQMNTAIDVVKGPTASNEVTCGLHGQVYLAETTMANRLKDAYLKVLCTRVLPEKGASEVRKDSS
jgi:hypothetical protein